MGTVLEHYAWAAIVAGWSLLLLVGLAGGDPFAAVQPGRDAPLVRFVKWAVGAWTDRRRDASALPVPRPATVHPATESGLHAAV